VVLDGAVLAGATWLLTGTPADAEPGLSAWATRSAEAWVQRPWLLVLPLVLLVLQGYTGATPGKRVAGVAVVQADTGLPTGLTTTVLRAVLHLLDVLSVVGLLRPLWHVRRQTFADAAARTIVLQTRTPLPHPWLGRLRGRVGATRAGRRDALPSSRALVSATAGVVCTLGVGFCIPSTWSASLPGLGLLCPINVDPVDGIDVSMADISRQDTYTEERRLWVVRSHQEPGPLDVRWTWIDTRDARTPNEIMLEATVTGDSSVGPFLVQQVATPRTPPGYDDGTLSTSALRVDADRFADPGDTTVTVQSPSSGWTTVQSRVVVDGVVAGKCTVSWRG